MYNFLSDGLVDTAEPFARWISLALVSVFIIIAALALITKNDALKSATKYFAIALVLYAFAIGAIMLGFNVYENFKAEYLIVFIPLAVTFVIFLGSFAAIYILKSSGYQGVKKATYILLTVCVLTLITSLVFIAVYYKNKVDSASDFEQIMLYLSSLILIAIISASAITSKDTAPLTTKEIARAGICVALSFALSYVKLFSMSKGGSVTLASMLPIMMFSYIYGTRKGVFVGLIYGILQSLQDPWIIHPAQFLLDYPIAFASLGLAGVLRNTKLNEILRIGLGVIIGGAARFVSHVLSGTFAFDVSLWGSMLYNSYVLIDLVIVMAVGIFLMRNKNFKKLLKT